MKNPVAMRFAALAAIAASFAAFASANAYAVTATKDYVDRRDAATLSAATNAAQTAITAATNGLASAASVKANAAAIAAERTARESAGYLTAESDPVFAAWTNGTSIVAGFHADCVPESGTAFGSMTVASTNAAAYGSGAKASAHNSAAFLGTASAPYTVAIGDDTKASDANAVCIGSIIWTYGGNFGAESHGNGTFNIATISPSMFYFDAARDTARTLQSYLDERATTSDLADVKAMISETNETFASAVNAAARALVKSKLESLDRAKSSIGETIAALQSIYNETETK